MNEAFALVKDTVFIQLNGTPKKRSGRLLSLHRLIHMNSSKYAPELEFFSCGSPLSLAPICSIPYCCLVSSTQPKTKTMYRYQNQKIEWLLLVF